MIRLLNRPLGIRLMALTVLLASPLLSRTGPEVQTSQEAAWPSARDHFAMVFDSGRGKVVLFGGNGIAGDEQGFLGDTWEWDGSWKRVADSGPEARSSVAMAYDATRRETILFGGVRPRFLFEDTWKWDGESWIQLKVDGPPARYSPAMAFDSDRGVVVLFGGRGVEGVVNDTWEWDGGQWRHVACENPPPARARASLVYDPAKGRMLLLGGGGRGFVLNDLWEWDGHLWSELDQPTRPSSRTNQSIVRAADLSRLILFGGNSANDDILGDMWSWDGTDWTPLEAPEPKPDPRDMTGMVYDSHAKRILLFGGRSPTRGHLADFWEWKAGSWRKLGQ